MNEKTIAHLGFIQSVINRMAGNSLALKGAALALCTAVVTVMAALSSFNTLFVFAALSPIVLFWLLDAKYLKLERQYRQLYEAVRTESMSSDFSMDSSLYENSVPSLLRTAFSWSVFWFYLVLLAMLAASSYIACHLHQSI